MSQTIRKIAITRFPSFSSLFLACNHDKQLCVCRSAATALTINVGSYQDTSAFNGECVGVGWRLFTRQTTLEGRVVVVRGAGGVCVCVCVTEDARINGVVGMGGRKLRPKAVAGEPKLFFHGVCCVLCVGVWAGVVLKKNSLKIQEDKGRGLLWGRQRRSRRDKRVVWWGVRRCTVAMGVFFVRLACSARLAVWDSCVLFRFPFSPSVPPCFCRRR